VDPLQFKYPHYTPYQYAGNKPISYIDLDGLEEAKLFDPSGTNIKVVSTNQNENNRIVKALNLLKLYDPKGFEKILQNGKPIEVKFAKLNDQEVYQVLSNIPGTSTFQNNSSINILKGSTNTEFEFCGYNVVPTLGEKGNIISGKAFRIPDINEQEEKRKEVGANYLPINDLREIEPSDNSYADVKSITIELDPIFTKGDKELTSVLGHEFFGHTSFNILNPIMGWIWQELEEIIQPQKKGHADHNPGGTDSDTIESDIRKKYSGLNEQYKKNRK
jgi:hypothetical protein